MVSTLRYSSFKETDFKGRWSFFMLVVIVGIFFLVALEHKVTMFFVVLLYVASGIVEEVVTRRKSRAIWRRFQSWRAIRRFRVEDGSEEISEEISEDDREDVIANERNE